MTQVKKYITAFVLMLAGALSMQSAVAQNLIGEDILTNGDLVDYTGTAPRLEPTAWKCTNYPLKQVPCTFQASPAALSIMSKTVGKTAATIITNPVNPQWWQLVDVRVAGLYELSVSLTLTDINNGTASQYENPAQGFVVKTGTTTVLSVPYKSVPVGVKTPKTVPVILGVGPTYLNLGTATRTTSGTGYRYDYSDLSLKLINPQ